MSGRRRFTRSALIALGAAVTLLVGLATEGQALAQDAFPTATDSWVTAPENGSVMLDMIATGDGLTYTITSYPTEGTLSNGGPGGQIPDPVYTPKPNYVGSDSLGFSVKTEEGFTASATISITVSATGAEGVGQPVAAGGTLHFGTVTDTDPRVIVGATVTTPNAGDVTITSDPTIATPANVYALTKFDVDAPQASAADPLRVFLDYSDGDLPSNTTAAEWQIFDDDAAVPPCSDGSGQASPDPCVATQVVDNTYLESTVLTSSPGTFVLALPDLASTTRLNLDAPGGFVAGSAIITIAGVSTATPTPYIAGTVQYLDTSTTPPTVLGSAEQGRDTDITLPAGYHTVVASYLGGLNLEPSMSAPQTFYVNPFDAYFGANPADLSKTPGDQYIDISEKVYLTLSGKGPYKVSVISGSLPPGVKMSPGGTFSGAPTEAGSFPLTFQIIDSEKRVDLLAATYLVLPMTLVPNFNTSIPIDVAASGSVIVHGGAAPYVWALTGGALPPGMTFSYGRFGGTPTTAGTYTFTVGMHDSAKPAQNTVSGTYTMTVTPMGVEPPSLPQGAVGKAYPSTTLHTSGGKNPKKWVITAGTLPAGMKFSTLGALSGTPTQAGTFPVTITVTDSAKPTNVASTSLTLVVAGPVITSSRYISGSTYRSFTETLKAINTDGTVRWSVTAGQLPPGLTLTPAGKLSGTVTQPVNDSVTITVTDSAKPANSTSQVFPVYFS